MRLTQQLAAYLGSNPTRDRSKPQKTLASRTVEAFERQTPWQPGSWSCGIDRVGLDSDAHRLLKLSQL